ncbi:hypothetical protein OQ621_25035, partial [Escherichia coli]|nr:hypothetical protein [Escherichia coli]
MDHFDVHLLAIEQWQQGTFGFDTDCAAGVVVDGLSLIHISEPTRLALISEAVFGLKKGGGGGGGGGGG